MASYLLLGATGGIGSAAARRLTEAGHRVVLAARGEERLRELSAELDAPYVVCDATRSSEVDATVEAAIESVGELDGAVNLVGSIMLKAAPRISDDEWNDTINLNLNSAFYLVRAASKAMYSKGGSIVLMSSAAARIGLQNHEAVAAAKAGVIGLTMASAASLARRQIRVNCIAPGLVDTPLAGRLTANEGARKASEQMHALGRIGTPEDIAPVLSWLLDPASSWVSGQVIGVDGGLGTLRT